MLPTKIWFNWASGFREEYFFRNQPIRNKDCLWQPCLLMDRDESSNLCDKLTDDRRQTPTDGTISTISPKRKFYISIQLDKNKPLTYTFHYWGVFLSGLLSRAFCLVFCPRSNLMDSSKSRN